MTINKKDYMEFCKRMNKERGEYNDGYDLREIEEAMPDEVVLNTSEDFEGYFESDKDLARFVREVTSRLKAFTVGYVDNDTDRACYTDVMATSIDEAMDHVRALKPHRIFMVRENG